MPQGRHRLRIEDPDGDLRLDRDVVVGEEPLTIDVPPPSGD